MYVINILGRLIVVILNTNAYGNVFEQQANSYFFIPNKMRENMRQKEAKRNIYFEF